MYPLFWTTRREGIFMRFSYEFKKHCVEVYKSGSYPDTPDQILRNCFKSKVRQWNKLVDTFGYEALKHKSSNNVFTPEEKYELVSRVLAGEVNQNVAINAGIHESLLYQWVRKYRNEGYNGLINKPRGCKSKKVDMKKIGTRKPPKPNESEHEELLRLRAENEYIKAENEVIKKEIALREEKQAALLKAKRQRLSKNLEKKGSD